MTATPSKYTVRDKPLSSEELAEEVRHFMEFKEHPERIAKALNRHPSTIRRLAYRRGWVDISDYFEGQDTHYVRKSDRRE